MSWDRQYRSAAGISTQDDPLPLPSSPASSRSVFNSINMVNSITTLAAAAVFVYNVVASPAPAPTATFPIQSGKNDWDGYNKDAETSYSIPTAATAAPTAAGIAIEGGNKYVNYSTVGGLFLQDLPSTDPGSFSYVSRFIFISRRPLTSTDGHQLWSDQPVLPWRDW